MQTIQASRGRRTSHRAQPVIVRKPARHWRAAAVAMALGCTLSACGGGGGSSDPTSTPTTPTAPAVSVAKPRITIYLDGDSTNVGYDPDYASGFTPTTPAMRMQSDFDAALPGQVMVIDGSSLGNTFQWSVGGGGPNLVVPIATRLAKLGTPPDLVVTNLEINDQYYQQLTAEQYATWVYAWIQSVQASGSMPIIEEPNPICAAFANVPVSDQFVATMNSVATNAKVPVLAEYAAFKAQANWCTALLSVDNAHPNDAGYAFKESQYFAALLPIVKNRLSLLK